MTKQNNTNKAVELANMMAEEFKIIGAANNRLAEQMEQLLAITLNTPATATTPAPAPTGKPVPKKEIAEKVDEPVNKVEVDEEEGLDLDAMSLKELKELADENEIEYPKGVKKNALIDIIAEALIENAEEEDEAGTEEVEGGEEELTLEDLKEMSLAELKEIATENGVEFPKTIKKPALLDLLEEAFFSEEEEEGADEEQDEETEEEEELSTVIETEDGEIDLAEMNVKQLKAFAKEYELEVTAKTKGGLIAEILEQINGDEEADEQDEETEEEDGEDVAEQLGLNDMDVEELAEILSENGLSTKGKKQALIDRIVRAVEDGTIEVDEEEGE